MGRSSLRYCVLISYRMKFAGLHFSVQFSRLPLQSRSVATSNTVIICCGTYWLKLQSHFCLPIGPCDGRWLTHPTTQRTGIIISVHERSNGYSIPNQQNLQKSRKFRGSCYFLLCGKEGKNREINHKLII